LQRSYGNSYVGRVIQAKLTVGAPDDEYEQEADQVADRVMRMPDRLSSNQELSFSSVSASSVQRKCATCEKEKLQRKESGNTVETPATVPPVVHEVLSSPGQPLDPATRTFMEPRFGHDFSQVRVHTGVAAERSARDVNANAYTVGHDMVFGAGGFAPGTHEGRRLLAHELTHVVQQSKGSRRPQQIQRDVLDPAPNGALPTPTWAITSSAEPIPGVSVPGYEQPKASYTERDRNTLQQALRSRVAENEDNADNFLGDYGSALVDLWARYATEAMAEAADVAGWSLFGKLLKFVITESLIVISGAWAAKYGGKLAVFLFEEMIAATGEVVTEILQNDSGESDIQASRAAIDQMTKQLADEFKKLPKKVREFGSSAVAAVDYTSWLKDSPLFDLERFRIPPAFPYTPPEVVRAAVAQAIVGLLYGPSLFVYATRREQFAYGLIGDGYHSIPVKNVIFMELEPAPGSFVGVSIGPRLLASEILMQELYGRPIKEMPKIPLDISLVSRDNPDIVVRAALGEMSRSLRETFEPTPAIIGYVPGSYSQVEPHDAVLRAYPSKSPMRITRDVFGHVLAIGGGLLEHLYLYSRTKPGENLGSILAEIWQQRLSQELGRAEFETAIGIDGLDPLQSSEMLSPEMLAEQVWLHMIWWQEAGAEDLISKNVESMTLNK